MTRNPVLRHNEPMDQPVDSLLSRLTEAPVCPADGRGAEHFKAFAMEAEQASPDLAMVLRDERVEMLLRGVFEGSPYLMTLATRDPDRLKRVLVEPPEARFARLTEALADEMGSAEDMAAAKKALRRYKSEVALLVALADLGGVWPVMTVTRILSECADAAVATAVRFLFRSAHDKGLWQSPDASQPERESG
jgi:glutamate-ammonia-ligase adenylyltransferase